MRVLLINDGSDFGGVGQLFRRTRELLRRRGHQITELTEDHLKAFSSRLPHLNMRKAWHQQFRAQISLHLTNRFLRKMAWSVAENFRQLNHGLLKSYFAEVLDRQKFDVAHVFNIHKALSTNVFSFLKLRCIPIVYQISDYYFFCNNHWAYNRKLDAPCDLCVQHRVWPAFRYGCSNYMETFPFLDVVRRKLVEFNDPWKLVDRFIVTSDQSAKVLTRWGVSQSRQSKLLNAIDMTEFDIPTSLGREIVFYGSDWPEKGVDTFISALEQVREGAHIGIYLRSARPDLAKTFKEIAEKRNLVIRYDPDLSWNSGLKERIAREARAVVIPSRWWVTSEYVVYEAMLLGKAVIVSDRGGNSELIKHERTGLSFNCGNASQLAAHINRVVTDDRLAKQLGDEACKRAKGMFNEVAFTEKLESIYEQTCQNSQ